MSCGSAGPSTIISPLLTTWPSCAVTCLSFGIRYSWATPSRSVMTRRCLPLVSLPNETVPVTSASVPASFGARASNSSATRGRPPVMSRVLEVSCGIRARTSPTATCWPSFTVMIEPSWNVMLTGMSEPARWISLPSASSSFTCGRTPLAVDAARRFGSMTTSVDRPVTSSTCFATVTPSSTFSNFTAPAAVVVVDHHLARARDDDELALGVGDVTHQRREAHRAGRLRLDLRRRRRPRRCTADVEGPHRQLRPRLANRLRGNDANRFADVDEVAAAKVAAVARRAKAVAGVAGERRAHLDLVDAEELDLLDLVLAQQRSRRIERFLRFRTDDVGSRDASEDALAQRLDDLAAFDQRLHRDAVARLAIVLGHDEVLRHVDEAASQVTGVCRLQCRVGEPLARAMGADEVLQHVQAFAEVRRDRRLDDRAIGLGHQAAHACELPDLCRRTARTGVCHHEDRVERILLHRLAVGIGHFHRAELSHHRLGDVVSGSAPDVDDLVVALALRDETRGVLRLDLLHLRLGIGDDLVLFLGHQHVVGGERDAAARGQSIARLHQPVG